MAIAKRTARDRLAGIIGDRIPLLTSGAGNVGGTTFVCPQLIGYGPNFYNGYWALIESGTCDSQYRQITGLDSATGTVTVTPAYSAQIATNVIVKLHAWAPWAYTDAFNEAIRSTWPMLYKPTVNLSLTISTGVWIYALPAGIIPENVRRIMIASGGQHNAPYEVRDDAFIVYVGAAEPYTYNIIFGRSDLGVSIPTGQNAGYQTIYIFCEMFLTPFDLDSTWGILATDATTKVELTENTNAWELFMLYAKGYLLSNIAAHPMTADKAMMLQLAQGALGYAMQEAPRLRMPRIDEFIPGQQKQTPSAQSAPVQQRGQ